MGLKETFQNAAVTIVKAFGNVAKTCTYTQEGPQKYNEITGVVTKTEVIDTPDIIFDEFTKDEIGKSFDGMNNIMATDVKGLLPSGNLDKITKPNNGDKIVDDERVEYTVLGVKTDPAEALYILLLRNI